LHVVIPHQLLLSCALAVRPNLVRGVRLDDSFSRLECPHRMLDSSVVRFREYRPAFAVKVLHLP